jgi:CheY-like chemotaxis protein
MSLKNRRIFIVEDNWQNRVVYQMMLIRHEALVNFESWGTNAIASLRKLAHVDVIILDLTLGQGISGFDLFDQIRELPNFETVPIVAVSAMEPAIAIPEARTKGFAGFIAKPIDIRTFPDQLAMIIAGEPIWHVGERGLS